MTELRFTLEAPVSREAIVGALTDFTARRPDLWPDLDPEAYEVREVDATSALVREGTRSPRLWALESYDWSTPGTVTWTVRESNFCTPGSFMSAQIEPAGDGSRVHITWSRTGVGLKGKMIVGMMRMTKGKLLASSLRKAIAALPASDAEGGSR